MEIVVPVGGYFFDEQAPGDSGYGFFARGVDLGYEQYVAVIEAPRKLLQQGLGPGIAVRLEGYYQAALRVAVGKGFKDRPDFGWVVTIVVQDQHSPSFPFYLKPALHARHVLQPRLDGRPGYFQLMGHCNRREGIEHVVAARDSDFHFAQFLSVMEGPIRAAQTAGLHLSGLEIRLRRKPVGCEPLFDSRQNGLDVFVFEAQNRLSVKRDFVYELKESISYVADVPVVVEVFKIYIGDNCDGRGQQEKSAVTLIRFGHHEFAASQFGIGAPGI